MALKSRARTSTARARQRPSLRALWAYLPLLLLLPVPAAAQQIAVEFHDGRVNLRATSSDVRAILAEWSRVGQVLILNADRIADAPVSLDLANVPERDALDMLLSNAAGYVASVRESEQGGASAFTRIVILPSSVAPEPPPPPPPLQSPLVAASNLLKQFRQVGLGVPDDDEAEEKQETDERQEDGRDRNETVVNGLMNLIATPPAGALPGSGQVR